MPLVSTDYCTQGGGEAEGRRQDTLDESTALVRPAMRRERPEVLTQALLQAAMAERVAVRQMDGTRGNAKTMYFDMGLRGRWRLRFLEPEGRGAVPSSTCTQGSCCLSRLAA